MTKTFKRISRFVTGILAVAAMLTASAALSVSAANESDTDKPYTITAVDGEPDWNAIPELTLDNILWKPDCAVRASGQLCYDDDTLYVHLKAVEKDIRAEYTEHFSPVYQDSCLEFFFMPTGGDRYFHFEINPNGCLYLGFGSSVYDSRQIHKNDMTRYFDIRTNRTSDGWEVFCKIPKQFIAEYYEGFEFAGGIRANIYKCGDKTAQAHYLAWQPVKTKGPAFHKPEFFGEMVFENK